MTMMDAKQVIAGLRRKNAELKDQIEAIKTYVETMKNVANNKVEANVSGVLVADAILKLLGVEE